MQSVERDVDAILTYLCCLTNTALSEPGGLATIMHDDLWLASLCLRKVLPCRSLIRSELASRGFIDSRA